MLPRLFARQPRVLRMLSACALAGVLAALCGMAAAGALEQARRQGKLVVAMAYVVPDYRAGMKFRTPDAIDSALAEDLAKRLQLPLTAQRGGSAGAVGTASIAMTAVAIGAIPTDHTALRPDRILIPTGYQAGPMAIMRSDTRIKTWQDLKGRPVCLAEGGRYVGTLAAQYGAIEKVFRAPADSLLNLRTGQCDAAVHDDVFLEELLKLPEWKKFSARLPSGARWQLAFAVSATDAAGAAFLRKTAQAWQAGGTLAQWNATRARATAFEVYLDQDVPDCH